MNTYGLYYSIDLLSSPLFIVSINIYQKVSKEYNTSHKMVITQMKTRDLIWEAKNMKDNKIGRSKQFKCIAVEWVNDLKPQLKQSSISKYKNTISLYLIPMFGDRTIESITYSEVYTFCMKMLKEGGSLKKGLSPKSVNGVLSVLRSVFKYARNKYNVLPPDIANIYIKQPAKSPQILSIEEQLTINAYLFKNLSPCNIGILLCLYTGIRIGEVCALQWKDINISEKTLFVHRAMQRIQVDESNNKKDKTEIVILPPKSTCSIRKIPIPDEMIAVLVFNMREDDAFILTGQCNKYMEPRTLENHFRSIKKACGISNIKFHALRHTFATRCIELGFDIKCLSEILGHASVSITLNRYVHPSMQLKQTNMNKLSVLLKTDTSL